MHIKIVNPHNKAESWERVYVSPEVEISLVSKDCLVRLGVIDPTQFLSDKEVKSFSINTVDESIEKLSACEKSFLTEDDGSINCKCDRRSKPPVFEKEFYEQIFDELVKRGGDLSTTLASFLRYRFKASAMNICQTQSLPMMNVPKMTVELKEGFKETKAKRTTRVITSPWH